MRVLGFAVLGSGGVAIGGAGGRDAIATVAVAIGLQKWLRESAPDGVGIEREEELDRAAGEERGENGVDGAVDMVEGQDVQEPVARGVLPGRDERAALRRQCGLGQQDALGPVRGARGEEHHAGAFGVGIVIAEVGWGGSIRSIFGTKRSPAEVLGQLDQLGVRMRCGIRGRVWEWRREDLLRFGEILGRVQEQQSLGVRQDVLQLGGGEGW